MKKSIALLLAALFLTGFVAEAQKSSLKSLPKRSEAFRPDMVVKGVFSETMAQSFPSKKYGQTPDQVSSGKNYWDVYSDRDNNVTYAAAKAKDAYSSLSFREKVRIAQIKNNFALVYSVPEEGGVYPYIPANAEWKGWVPMENLILWDKALVGNTGEYTKCLIGNAVQLSNAADNVGKLFTHPTAPKSFVKLPSMPNSIFYILKREGSMLLLALEKEVGENPENIYGWVDSQSVIPWWGRLALEPTWEIDDVQSFSSTGVYSEIFADQTLDTKLGTIPFTTYEMPMYKTEFYRTMGRQWRFPLLSSPESVVYTAAVPITSSFLDINASSNVASEDELGADLNNVNILFVLDGSRAYEQYYPLIFENFKTLRSELLGYSVRIGIQFYRDVRNEDFATEFEGQYDSRDRRLETFLQEGGKYGYRDNASDPALLKGISDALDKADFLPSETNVVIVVGGRGDASDNKELPKNLADRLDATNVKLYGIQLQNNPSSGAYGLFNYQLMDMLYSKIGARVSKTGSDLDSVMQTVKESDGVNKASYYLNGVTSASDETHFFPAEGLVDEDVFVSHLNEIYAQVSRNIKLQKQELASGAGGLSTLFTLAYLTSADRTNRKFFKLVAAYDEDEFNLLMEKFSTFYQMALMSGEVSNTLYSNLLDLLSKVPENVETKPDERGCYEALRIFEGVEYEPAPYKGAKLKEIREGKTFTVEQGRRFLNDFAVKYRQLLEIQKNPYLNSSRINGKMYYWIPIEYLP